MFGFNVYFLKSEVSTQLNGLFMANRLRGMLYGKQYLAVDMVLHFLEDCGTLGSSSEREDTQEQSGTNQR